MLIRFIIINCLLRTGSFDDPVFIAALLIMPKSFLLWDSKYFFTF